jgi:hypothetical protein
MAALSDVHLQTDVPTPTTNRVPIRLEALERGKRYIFHFRILNATEDSFWEGTFVDMVIRENRLRFYPTDDDIRQRYGREPIQLSPATTLVYLPSDDTTKPKKKGGKSYRKRKSRRRKSRRR